MEKFNDDFGKLLKNVARLLGYRERDIYEDRQGGLNR